MVSGVFKQVAEHFRKVRFYPDLGGVHAVSDVKVTVLFGGTVVDEQWRVRGRRVIMVECVTVSGSGLLRGSGRRGGRLGCTQEACD